MKEFTLFNGAAKIIGAGLSTFGIQIEVPDTIATGAAIVGGITVLGFLLYRLLKKKSPEKIECGAEGCTNPPTDGDTLECSLLDVVGIVKLREGYIGVTKEKFFFFWRDYYNHDLPQIDLTYYTYHEVAPILKALGKNSANFETYCRVNKKVLVLLEYFLKQNVTLYPLFSNEYCLDCKRYWAKWILDDKERLPNHSYLINLLVRMPSK